MSESPWYKKNSNEQTSGWKAMLTWPGILWPGLPIAFFSAILIEYLLSAYNHLPFHPLWMRVLAVSLFGAFVIFWFRWVFKSESKRKLHDDGSYK